MPITVSNMAAIQAMLNSQKAAIDVTVNAARDNVNANVDADAATLAGVVNAARDNVNANVDAEAVSVTAAVNAKGVIRSIQRGVAAPDLTAGAINTVNVAIASVDMAKAQVIVSGIVNGNPSAISAMGSAQLTSATTLEIKSWKTSGTYVTSVFWQVIEYF